MTDRLEKYAKKRDPARTNEPFSAEQTRRSTSADAWRGRFVIHQHAATRMHFDLRLQVGNTLQSFAVPRGISLDPSDKHLAVHTEDHPLSYLYFEEIIPAGNYGAGAMIMWDTGGFHFLEADGRESLARGKLDFVLDGFKAKGRFALIATGRRVEATGLAGTKGASSQWLLIKKRDAHSGEGLRISQAQPRSVTSGLTIEELADRDAHLGRLEERAAELCADHPPPEKAIEPAKLIPMLCSTESAPRQSDDYLYELKLDGVRIACSKRGQDIELRYRSGRAATRNYAEIALAARHLGAKDVVLDGEIVTFDESGRPNFQRLAPRIQARKREDIQRASAQVPVVYMVFDVLRLGSHDLRNVPLERRKELLSALVPGQGYIRALDHIVARGKALWELCESQHLEGMIAKKRNSPYVLGPKLSGLWNKDKREEDHDFAVVGFTRGSDGVKALCLASFVGDRAVYRGRVGSGFSERERKRLLLLLEQEKEDQSSVFGVPDDLIYQPVALHLVASVRSHGFTEAGHLRAPVYRGIKEEREPQECREGPHDEWLESDARLQPLDQTASDDAGTESRRSRSRLRAKLTNPTKVFWPDEGYTKGDLIDYYESIAPFMLPHLAERPVVLVRYPDGIGGKSFYQWRAPDKTPSWIETVELYDEKRQSETGSGKATFLIDSVDALLYVINLGCIPLHVLASRKGTREDCDFITIDFDLGQRPFADGVRLALSLRELCDQLNLPSFPKTSGQRGLHVLLPLGDGVKFESAKLLCELFGRILVGRHPQLATMERRIEKRGDKVYIDVGQTGRSRTIVAPYSVRAFAGARVSTPLAWQEIHLALSPAAFTIETVPERLHHLGDPMAGMLGATVNLQQAVTQLAQLAAL